VHWLQSGDLNTKYFHHKANTRKRKNFIHNIHDSDGNNRKDSNKIHDTFSKHFQNIFTSSTSSYSQNIFDVVRNRVSSQDYNLLNNVFTETEVLEAISSMKANSAPGPDGFLAMFFQKYWEIIGPDIMQHVSNVLNNKGSIDDSNHTFISLIPKINNPITPSDFRPISLCY